MALLSRFFTAIAPAAFLLAAAASPESIAATKAGSGLPRVMSMNVCTDQLVLELAAPGQIVSLSNLSDTPSLSFLHDKAAHFPKNQGLAEEALAAHPDIVVTGTYSPHHTAALLKRLGVAVAAFPYTQTLDTIPRDIRRMGRLLHRDSRAELVADAFERSLSQFRSLMGGEAPRAIIYEQNGVTYGAGTLEDSVLKAAGLVNIAAIQGYRGMAPYPLELLVADRPDLVLLGRSDAKAPALADEIARHPALAALGTAVSGNVIPEGALACGGPFTIRAIEALSKLRKTIPVRARGGPTQ